MWFFHLRKMQEGPSPFFVSLHLSYMKFNKLDLPVTQLPKKCRHARGPTIKNSKSEKKAPLMAWVLAKVTKALTFAAAWHHDLLLKKNDGDARKMQNMTLGPLLQNAWLKIGSAMSLSKKMRDSEAGESSVRCRHIMTARQKLKSGSFWNKCQLNDPFSYTWYVWYNIACSRCQIILPNHAH